ncbi:MAG: winged helix-turn-helix domain-containing protein [Anaerolineae bacterium]
MRISMATARRIALRAQGLDGSWDLTDGREGAAQAIERLSYVQIDSLSVVERAHHHTLWVRVPSYERALLNDLQQHDRRIFEYWHWGHVAAYLPLRDYRYHAQRMRTHAHAGRSHDWLAANQPLATAVLDRIRNEGPLAAADFYAPPGWERGSWWHWKPAKQALEHLFTTGQLMVAGRRSFQRLYDLPERVLPAGLPPPADAPEITREELARFVVRRTLSSYGIVGLQGNFSSFLLRHGRKAVTEAVYALAAEGQVLPVEIEGLEGRTFYVRTDAVAQVEEAGDQVKVDPRVHILSPFDNMVISRALLSQLFGFAYRLGSYTSVAKRTSPHFGLPVLYGDRFVAQVDAKADRKARVLNVRNVLFEAGAWPLPGLATALVSTMAEFAIFNGCDDIALERTEPGEALPSLLQALPVPLCR